MLFIKKYLLYKNLTMKKNVTILWIVLLIALLLAIIYFYKVYKSEQKWEVINDTIILNDVVKNDITEPWL